MCQITKQETTLKDAESSSGISESEEEDEEGDNGQIKKVKKEVYKKEELKQDTDTAHEGTVIFVAHLSSNYLNKAIMTKQLEPFVSSRRGFCIICIPGASSWYP